MIKVHDTAIIGMSELRAEMPKLTREFKIKTIIVMKKGEPVAVLEDYTTHEEKEKLLNVFEDLILGYLAKERESKSKKSDYIPEEKAMKKLGITI